MESAGCHYYRWADRSLIGSEGWSEVRGAMVGLGISTPGQGGAGCIGGASSKEAGVIQQSEQG